MMRRVDDVLLDRWISTWVHLRERRVTTIDRWPVVHVDSASRRTELVCADPGVAAVSALLPHVAGDDGAMLTVVGRDLTDYRTMALPPDVRVDRDDETLMSTLLRLRSAPAAPDGLTGTFQIDGPRTTYRLDDGERVAAEATMAVEDGRWVTFDAVETTPAFRRRGLARHVMTTMCARAAAAGATHGVLVASADGRALYEALGWTVERELLSLMGTRP